MKRVYLSQFSIIVEDQFVLLPYSAASVWAYSHSFFEIQKNYKLASDILFIRKPIAEVMKDIKDPDVFGFSVYSWNSNYTDTLAKEIKRVYPDCLIVYGGPHVPDNNEDMFVDKPWIDICVHQEGEISFKDILYQNLKDKDWSKISGISYNDNLSRVFTGESNRILDLNELPSPYLTGIFDGYVERNPKFTLNAILETNRGCPYQCTFCDWGGATFSKLVKFQLDRISAEIDWMGKNDIDCVVNADANFGIFKERDSSIVDLLISTKNTYNYPTLFTTNWAKHNNEFIVGIAAKLKEHGLLRKFAVALQSLDTDTLKNIKRKNMKINSISNVLDLAKKHDITVMVELIMTLPGETYESWIKNYCSLLMYDNLYIESYPLSILPNSEMNDPNYKKKYGLKTTTVKLPFKDLIAEQEEMVVETSTMDFEDAQKAWIFTWLVRSMHSFGFLYYVANFIVKEYGITHYDFYKNLEKGILAGEGVVKRVYEKQQELIRDKKFSEFYLTNWWVQDIGDTHRSTFYSEVKEIVKRIYDHPLLDEIFKFQNLGSYNPYESYPSRQSFSYNFLEDKKQDCVIVFSHPGKGNHKTYKSFISLNRGAVWKSKMKSIAT
jgi:radical SAM superfamily enzyme YgiQ (UPF0313 family)